MSTIYHIQRDNQFMYYSTGNEKLNYTVQDEKAVFNKTDNSYILILKQIEKVINYILANWRQG